MTSPDPRDERGTPPVRTCAACRARAPRDVLLRWVAVGGSGGGSEEGEGGREPITIQLDLERVAHGRGLNLGPSPLCLERAHKRGALQRQWRRNVSRDAIEIAIVGAREQVVERLRRYLQSAWRRGGLTAVASVEGIEPIEARVLWESEAHVGVVEGIPPARATNPRTSAKIKALTGVLSEFTFTRVGAMKRRPEAPEACEALERCGGGVTRGSAMTRARRVGAGPSPAGPDGRNG